MLIFRCCSVTAACDNVLSGCGEGRQGKGRKTTVWPGLSAAAPARASLHISWSVAAACRATCHSPASKPTQLASKNGCAAGGTKIRPLLQISNFQKCCVCQTNRFGIKIIRRILETKGKNNFYDHVSAYDLSVARQKKP